MTFNELKEKVIALWNSNPINERGYYTGTEFLNFLNYGRIRDMPDVGVLWHEREGGGEGGAEDVEAVISVDGVYYKVYYDYRSFNGYEYEDAQVLEVERVERMAVFYE